MESSLQRRRKIALLFLVGVGIPSIVLSYLAFRGIRNELALMEQRLLDEHCMLSQLVSDTIAGEITTAEQALANAVAGQDTLRDFDAGLTLSELQQQRPLIDEVFYVEDLERIQLPAADLLYYSDGSAIAFSPDGERIAFFSGDAIRTIAVQGGRSAVLVAGVRSGRHGQVAWCPDGSMIAHDAEGKIWITRVDGGAPHELRTGLPEGAWIGDFSWSPDGEKIAFVGEIGGEAEFWLIGSFLP